MERDESTNSRLNLGVVNGIILALIGLLVLLTLLVEDVEGRQLIMDVVAGAALVIGGGVSFVWGWFRRRPGDVFSSDETE